MDYVKIVEYLRQCPQINKLLPVAGEQTAYSDIVMPVGGSSTANIQGRFDNLGGYEGDIIPIPTIYKDYQINSYRPYDVKDNNPPQYNGNALTLEEVDEIFKWVSEQDNAENFPDVSEKVVSVECTAVQPYIRGVDEDLNIVCYAITFRVWYVNQFRKQRSVYYEL